ncbi:MAG TPA: dTDP-4-dehydrorhamnose reductase [Caulobacteraceae bacterium]|nr:dTDP-4-dehydrorhamnose reductase [Caulobacteraceae bacterium]
MSQPIDILLTGGDGQVGTELRRLAPSHWRFSAPDENQLNFTDPTGVAAAVASKPWAAVINAAAYTAVDKAETDVAIAWQVNALGPAVLAASTAEAGIPLVHISTDYVFSGDKAGYYAEGDPVAPLGVYGASKEGGEQAVRTANPRHAIVRTAWLVSPHGGNFIKTMLRLGVERPALRVVDDQRGCPTSASDLAAALIVVAERLINDPGAPTGDYHFVNAGEASWCEFARAIFEVAEARGRAAPSVEAISTADYPTPARRPANSRLSTDKIRRDFGVEPRPWRVAMEEIVERLLAPAEGQRS